MDIVLQIIAAYVATVAAGITLESPKEIVLRTGIIGSVSYAFHLLLVHQFHVGKSMSYFAACLLASIISQIFARKYKSAVILFYVPTFFLYVPGSSIYQMAYHFISGDAMMASKYLLETLTIAGSIALGIFVADSIVAIYLAIKGRSEKKIKKRPKKFKSKKLVKK